MTILAIECSTPTAAIAVLREGEIVFHETFESDRAHNSLIFDPLRRAVETVGDGLSHLVVGTGPGSYSGVRIGIAAALGLSLVRKLPLIGISSFLALPDAEDYAVVGDARRQQWHFSTVAGRKFVIMPKIGTGEETQQLCETAEYLRTTDQQSPPFCQATLSQPCARILAALAAQLSETEWEEQSRQTPEPYYLAAPFITTSKKTGVQGQ